MSRFNPHHNIEKVLPAAELWRLSALAADGSIFQQDLVWTGANAQLIADRFQSASQVNGSSSFLDQLEVQLSGLPSKAHQLAAEMIWVLDLFPSDIAPSTKRERIEKVWTWSGTPFPTQHDALSDAVLVGIGRPGMGYRQNLWRELYFLAKAVTQLKTSAPDDRYRILSDPWIFVDWLEAVSPGEKRQLKQILPYLLFPADFERISSRRQKLAILHKIDNAPMAELRALAPSELNKRLLSLRDKLESETGEPIDFYAEPERALWLEEKLAPAVGDEAVASLDQTDQTDQEMAPAIEQSGGTVFPSEPLNLILYGPPGTGKTYSVVERAVRTLDPAFHRRSKNDWPTLKLRFEELRKANRIVFVTFHQSYSYEDFVEGIRARTDDKGSIRYEVADGIFKRLCQGPIDQGFRRGEKFRDYEVIEQTSEILWLRKPNGSELPIAMKMLTELAQRCRSGEITVNDIAQRNAMDKLSSSRLEKFLVNGYNNILPTLVERLLSSRDASADPSDAKVLIIDEINRGNVSKIFGELITLLEETKRAGMPEAASVTLPYSRDQFSIPPNLYLIATMNTSDRSLTGLDLALRRRFAFEELDPASELLDEVTIDGINVADLLDAMNERIELLAGREFRIGHAWFMTLDAGATLEGLRRIFELQIVPYLQEVFFDDWARLRMVLNDHRKKNVADQFIIAASKTSEDVLGDSTIAPVQSWTMNSAAFGRPIAYQLIVGSTL